MYTFKKAFPKCLISSSTKHGRKWRCGGEEGPRMSEAGGTALKHPPLPSWVSFGKLIHSPDFCTKGMMRPDEALVLISCSRPRRGQGQCLPHSRGARRWVCSPLSPSGRGSWLQRGERRAISLAKSCGFLSCIHCPSSNLSVPMAAILLRIYPRLTFLKGHHGTKIKRLWPRINTTKESTSFYLNVGFLPPAGGELNLVSRSRHRAAPE